MIPTGQFSKGLFTQMMWVDFAIVGLIGIYLMIGLIRGSNKEILSLLSWFLAIAVSWSFASEFSEFLQTVIEHPSARLAAAFAGLLILTRLFTSFIFFLMIERTKKNRVSLVEHFAGMLVGVVRGVIVVAVIILLSGLTPLPKDSWWIQSKLIPPFQSSAIWVRDHIPSGMAGYIHFN